MTVLALMCEYDITSGGGGVPASSSSDVGCSDTQVLQLLFGRPVFYVQRNIWKYNQDTIILVQDIPLCLKYINKTKLNMYSF